MGNSGYAGFIETGAMATAVRLGYATAGTDTGHTTTDTANRWIINPVQLQEWGHTSIHIMTLTAQSIIRDFYGQRPRDAYFVGASTGGDQAMEEAEYFPSDYNGIVAGSPGLDYSHLIMSFIWNAMRVADHPANVIPNAELAVLNDAVLASCGGEGGLAKDPFLNDPQLCRFKPTSVQCRAGRTAGCLTPEEVGTAKHIYAGPRNPHSPGTPQYARRQAPWGHRQPAQLNAAVQTASRTGLPHRGGPPSSGHNEEPIDLIERRGE